MSRLGVVKIVEPMIQDAYDQEEERIWEGDLDSSPHGHHWSTSFHASSFPSDDPYACPRAALYSLMNVPSGGPVDRRGRMFMDAGKNLELELQRRFGKAGWLLTNDQTAGEEFQTGFVDEFTWLTGNPDLIVLPPGWDRGHVVEIKGKGVRRPPRYKQLIDPVAEMASLQEDPTPKHVKQLGAYIGMANMEFHKRIPYVIVCKHTWRVLQALSHIGDERGQGCREHEGCERLIPMRPVNDGTLIYIALDDGTQTHEYRYSLNARAFEEGRAQLVRWRENFINDELPERPADWLWSKEPFPCRFCQFKGDTKGTDICKADDKKGVTKLSESHAIGTSQKVRPDYDYQAQRERVLSRWGVNDTQKEESR